MGKKKTTQQTAQQNATIEDPVSQLKDTVKDLTDRVGKMGLLLGAEPTKAPLAVNGEQAKEEEIVVKKEETVVESAPPTDPKTFERPDMSAEDKKAQRAAKAAEKKARAEAAAAKKAAGPGAQPQQPAQKKEKPAQKKAEAQNGEQKQQKAHVAEDRRTPENESADSPPRNGPLPPIPNAEMPCPPSVLKTSRLHDPHDHREVKFDMCATVCQSPESMPPTPTPEDLPYGNAATSNIHPGFIAFASRCERGMLYEVDHLCKGFLTAFKEFFNEWMEGKENCDPEVLGADLNAALRPQIAYLTSDGRWALPWALGNIVRQLKKEISKLGVSQTQEDVNDWIDTSLNENFEIAYKAICGHLERKLANAKNILTYDSYDVVETLIRQYKNKGLSCCVVDSDLSGRGLDLVKKMAKEGGSRLQYTDLAGSGYAMQKSSMVVLGCSAVLSNGNVISATGSLQIALTAKAFNVPLLILSQSFKFVDKVQSNARMALLPRDCDEIIPADLITAVVTDIRILPPSSAPAVLKTKALDHDIN